jgi:hypothetical protein
MKSVSNWISYLHEFFRIFITSYLFFCDENRFRDLPKIWKKKYSVGPAHQPRSLSLSFPEGPTCHRLFFVSPVFMLTALLRAAASLLCCATSDVARCSVPSFCCPPPPPIFLLSTLVKAVECLSLSCSSSSSAGHWAPRSNAVWMSASVLKRYALVGRWSSVSAQSWELQPSFPLCL